MIFQCYHSFIRNSIHSINLKKEKDYPRSLPSVPSDSMDWKDSSGSSTSSWMLSVSSVAKYSSSVGTFMGCARKGGAGSRLQLIPISLVVTFSTAFTPRKVREKSHIFLFAYS